MKYVESQSPLKEEKNNKKKHQNIQENSKDYEKEEDKTKTTERR